MVHENPWNAGNPYISTLIESLLQDYPDCSVAWGRELFWSDAIFNFDVVHFHWPQAFMAGDRHTEEDLKCHIEKLKMKGVKIVATCHDLEPHYNQCAKYKQSLTIVYSHADLILHLGEYSKRLFEEKYPNTKHQYLSHHLYNTVYDFYPSKEDSIKYLGLQQNKKYILSFGTFRSDDERNLIKLLYKKLNDNNIYILAPGYMDIGSLHTIKGLVQRVKRKYYQYRYHIFCSGKTFAPISDNVLPYYFGASDLVFIQRVKILNSGNVFLPMLFGKIVVGPDTGNIGEVLKKWGYPAFDTNLLNNIDHFVKEGFALSKNNYALRIKDEQLSLYKTPVVVNQLHSYYESLLR